MILWLLTRKKAKRVPAGAGFGVGMIAAGLDAAVIGPVAVLLFWMLN